MATLKEHQAAMVDLLANGSDIPAYASRMAHAMHDVLGIILCTNDSYSREVTENVMCRLEDATTSGLNDKANSKREKALKTDSPAKRPTPAEQRVKELTNTINQLRTNNAKLRAEIQWLKAEKLASEPEQAGCRREDTQVCEHNFEVPLSGVKNAECVKCGVKAKDIRNMCNHYSEIVHGVCFKCGEYIL